MNKNILLGLLFVVVCGTNVWAETKEYPCISYAFQNYAYDGEGNKVAVANCDCGIIETDYSYNFSVIAGYNFDSRMYSTYHKILEEYINVQKISFCADQNDVVCEAIELTHVKNGTYYFKNNNASNDYYSCDLDVEIGFSNPRKHIPGQDGIPISTQEKTATIESVTGQLITATVTDTQIPDSSGEASDVMAIVTQAESGTTIKRDDGSVVEIQANTVASFNPSVNIDGKVTNLITLIRGEVSLSIECANLTEGYVVKTPTGSITVLDSCAPSRRASTATTQFSVNYSQNGLDNDLKVSVVTGSVMVTAKDGSTTTLAAGESKSINARVTYSSWVLPIDGDKIYGGKVNQLVWTAYPGAATYLLEYNFPIPVFSDENTRTTEFTTTLLVTDFVTYNDLIIYTIPLSKGLDGKTVEARIFAVDANGSIMPESVSSDRFTVTWQDL